MMEIGRGKLTVLEEGTILPEIKKQVTQDNINLYSEASQDFNPIHIDEDFARNTPLGGTIAHGMLILAYISQMMANAFGQSWLTGGKLNVRFKTPARPGDDITVSGKLHRHPAWVLLVPAKVIRDIFMRFRDQCPVIQAQKQGGAIFHIPVVTVPERSGRSVFRSFGNGCDRVGEPLDGIIRMILYGNPPLAGWTFPIQGNSTGYQQFGRA